jgi:hypothetical protein
MKKTLRVIFLVAMTLMASRSALADMVGEKYAQSETFRQFVSSQKALEEQISRTDAEISSLKAELEKPRYSIPDWAKAVIICIPGMVFILSFDPWMQFAFMALSIGCAVLYICYLIRRNPMKWRLMTSGKTVRRLWRNLMRRNGLVGVAFLAVTLFPSVPQAATNVLQDIKMYYAGTAFEKGYVECKYARERINLGYDEVNGVAVIPSPEPGFEREYDVLAHLQGLGLGVAAEDFVTLYGKAATDGQRGRVYALLAATGKEVAVEGARRIVEAICAERGTGVGVGIQRFKALLAAFADSNNRLAANGLVRTFLELSVGRVKNLEGLDSIVELAVENDAFEIIREATASAMKSLPSRLPYAEALYAARICFRIDKDMARHYFQAIRFEFPEFMKSETLTLKLAGLIHDLSGVTAFLPLYDNEALYSALRRQSNDLRVAVTGFFDVIDPGLAAVAFSSIGMEPVDMVFSNPQTLVLLARLTSVYKKDSTAEFLGALKRTVVEYKTPYTKDVLFEAVEKAHQSPSLFTESVLTQDMNTDCRFNQNDGLILSLIRSLNPEQVRAYESYFIKKSSLHAEVLDFLFASHKEVFYRLLVSLFSADPASVARFSFPNDIMDLGTVAPAFTKTALAEFSRLPAAFFVASQALSGATPDVRTARRALVPELDDLFKTFLSSPKKELTEKDAIDALILLTLAQRQGVTSFADEAFVLEKMVSEYFSQDKHAGLAKKLEGKKQTLAELKKTLSERRAREMVHHVDVTYLAFLLCHALAAMYFSIKYACNIMIPGKNHYLLSCLVFQTEAFGAFVMSTIILLPWGVLMVLAAQLLRAFQGHDTAARDMRDGVAALDRPPALSPGGDAQDGGPGAWTDDEPDGKRG